MSAIPTNGGIRFHRPRRKTALAGAVVTAFAMMAQLLGVSAASAYPVGDARGSRVTGSAWGAQATLTNSLAGSLSLGKVALQALPCRPPFTSSNTVAGAKLPSNGSLVSLGVVVNEGTSTATATDASVVESSTVANVSLLGGLIRATTVKASATTTRGGGNSGDTDFVQLVVGTTVVTGEVAPNTSISLLGGSVRVVLNEQKVSASGKFQVNAIHVYLTNYLGYSGDIVVAHAETNLVAAAGQLSGHAYLSSVKLQAGDVVNAGLRAFSGRQNVVYLPCSGGNKVSDAVGATLIPDANGGILLTSATSRSTVSGTIDHNAARSYSTHTLETLSLLGGRITADLVKTEALTESFAGGVRSQGTTTLVNLKIDDVAFTTTKYLKVNLPGIGYVRLNEKRCVDDQPDTSPCVGEHYNAITVYALHVVVDTPNALLPLKAEVIVGAAHSGAGF